MTLVVIGNNKRRRNPKSGRGLIARDDGMRRERGGEQRELMQRMHANWNNLLAFIRVHSRFAATSWCGRHSEPHLAALEAAHQRSRILTGPSFRQTRHKNLRVARLWNLLGQQPLERPHQLARLVIDRGWRLDRQRVERTDTGTIARIDRLARHPPPRRSSFARVASYLLRRSHRLPRPCPRRSPGLKRPRDRFAAPLVLSLTIAKISPPCWSVQDRAL